jgi:hypothetical protein
MPCLLHEMYPFLATMLHHQAERRTCITEKGYFGSIPGEAEEGDLIAIFFGLRIPFVLRPLAGGYIQVDRSVLYAWHHGWRGSSKQ